MSGDSPANLIKYRKISYHSGKKSGRKSGKSEW